MNFQNLNFDHVEAPNSWLPQHPPAAFTNDSKSTIRQVQQPNDEDSSPQEESVSPQPTVLQRAPTPPSHPTPSSSTPELYGPNRLFGDPATPPRAYNAGRPAPEPVVRFDEAQLAMFAADNSARTAGLKDELTLAAGKITPGVDDTPYIQYALEALTGDPGGASTQHYPSGSSNQSSANANYQHARSPSEDRRSYAPRASLAQPHEPSPLGRRHPTERYSDDRRESQAAATPVRSQPPSPRVDSTALRTDQRLPITRDDLRRNDPNGRMYPPLTFKPRILRPFSMMILMTLCLLMTAALIFSAVYSDRNAGLTPYPGSIYSGQYFVFRILPQLLAAVLFLYAQCISTTTNRVLPFTALASEEPHKRHLALFRDLYPKTFLWPQMAGPWQVKVFGAVSWLACFTIPLQSAAFTCVFTEGRWTWAAVQGVVWTLVALYILLTLATALLMVFWFGQWTGLVRDVRSIADLVPLLSGSNTMESYQRIGLAERAGDLEARLRDRHFDRLGYWNTGGASYGTWHGLGCATAQSASYGKRASYDPSVESKEMAVPAAFGGGSFKYLPWYLRDGFVAAYLVVAGVLLLALLVVAFLPQTRLEDGFLPLLSARPHSGAFSAANFLYSFLPSLLGTALFLAFQTLDQAVRVLEPWGALASPHGAPARQSVAADYAACLPLESTLRAVGNGDWRVAVLSLMAVLFALIPSLAGGLFMALTTPEGQVRMFPSMPVFGVLLALLFLYVGCLSLLVPRRGRLRMPRPVTSLAAVISLCAAGDLARDPAFRDVRPRRDLEGRLGAGRDEGVWFLGVAPGRDEQLLGVRRLNRFTEKRVRTMRAMV